MRIRATLLALVLVTAAAALAPGSASAACATYTYDSAGTPGSSYPNDPLYPQQWGLGQVKAPAAWARGALGAGVKIAIVDTGVDANHPDLKAKLDQGHDFVPYVAPSLGDPGITGPGCDGPGTQDENGHGTHVAGIAAAITNNGVGVAGTAPDARILPVRVLDANGTADDTTVDKGIRWAADNGAKVINLSLGGNSVVSQTPGAGDNAQAAVTYAYSKGAVVIAAAGNDTFPGCSYPAAAANAVCVAATDSNGMPAAYSNFPGSPGGSIALRAPGGTGSAFCEDPLDVWSTIWPGASEDCKASDGGIAGYDTLAGSSMSTPFVSGVAALLAGRGLSAGQILQCLKTTSSNHGSYDPAFGYGIVDADAATATCSASGTPSFNGGSGGGGGGSAGSGKHVKVTFAKTSRKKLARTGKLKVTVRSDRKVTVKLRAVVISGKKTTTGARATVKLKKAGSAKRTLKLSKKARRKLRKSKKASTQVRYTAGKESGVATAR